MSGTNTIQSCEDCLVRWDNFRHLTKSELQQVNLNRYEATFKPGEILIKQGSPASNALFISAGMAKNYIEGSHGRNFIMSILQSGRLIMGPGAYVTSRYTYSVSAITPVRACFISFDIFRQLVKVNGEFADSMLRDISAKSLKLHDRMVNLAQKKMPGRMAEALLYLSDEVFGSDEYEMILSRQELGEMTNMVKESVVRILKEFEESGIISIGSSMLKILNKEKLLQISDKG